MIHFDIASRSSETFAYTLPEFPNSGVYWRLLYCSSYLLSAGNNQLISWLGCLSTEPPAFETDLGLIPEYRVVGSTGYLWESVTAALESVPLQGTPGLPKAINAELIALLYQRIRVMISKYSIILRLGVRRRIGATN